MKRQIALAAFLAGLASASASADSLPGLKGPDHFGFTVPKLTDAISFFKDVIGCEEFYPLGPFADDQGTWMQDHLNVDPRAKITDMRLMRCGSGANLEIFEYSAEGSAKAPPRNSDVGGHHVAFYTSDITAAVAHLKAKGVKVLGDPTKMEQGPSAGETWVYFLAPWGMQLELVSYENGKAYEKDFKGRLWNPSKPAE